MTIKKIIEKLTLIRDNAEKHGHLSQDDQKILKSLNAEPVVIHQKALRSRTPKNDYLPLSKEQAFRLKIMEKTGTGSTAIH